jgi:hypothetical protein
MSRSFNSTPLTPNRLAQAVVVALAKDYHAHGPAAIAELRKNDPRSYFRLVLTLPYVEPPKPKEILSEYTEEQLEWMYNRAKQRLWEAKQWEKTMAGEAASEQVQTETSPEQAQTEASA